MPLATQPDFPRARQHMIESQLQTGAILDPAILDAINTVPRENFVPTAYRGVAYIDHEIPVAPARALLEPLVFARMLTLAKISKHDIVLDVACATGYSTCVLAQLAGRVVAVESTHDLVNTAKTHTKTLGIENAKIVHAALDEGYAQDGPYHAIFINGAIEEIPPALYAQLAEDGRIIYVRHVKDAVSGASGLGKLCISLWKKGALSHHVAGDAIATTLHMAEKNEPFTF